MHSGQSSKNKQERNNSLNDVDGGGPNPLLVMKNITKRFSGVLALDNVDLDLYSGEILGLIGENGAGKSTLMAILGGIHIPDAGQVLIDSCPVRLGSIQDAIANKVSLIHQELNLAGNLDIASNILLGREPTGILSFVKRKSLHDRASKLVKMVGLSVPLSTIVEDLSTAQQQLVEIAKALSQSSRILVLDEPTSSLSSKDAEILFNVMRDLKSQGVSMIYISHRLHEIEEMCDRVIALRDGRRVGELSRNEINRDSMVRLMVGRDVSRFFPENEDRTSSKPVLSVRSIKCASCKGEFTFDAYAGDVLGIAGLVGSGRSELVQCLFGVEPFISGHLMIDGKEIRIKSPIDAIKNGMALVPEDRKHLGLILEMAIKENISLPGLAIACRKTLNPRLELQTADEQSKALSIKTPSLGQSVECLSGGNQQKVALAKWLALSPRVLILDEPTRGIDVGSKSEIYKLIRQLADSGVAIVMVSSEMEEIIGISDRVLVMHEGVLNGELDRSELSEEKIMHLATGGVC
jgi:ribose transport system ATP-binding protein